MKIAVCISGIAKNHAICCPSIKKNLIEPYNCDVFCSFWHKSEEESQILLHDYQAKLMEFEHFNDNYKKVFNDWPHPYIMLESHKTPINAISMYYKIKRCNHLRRSWERQYGFKYDAIIRIRPDLELTSVPILPKELSEKKIYIPSIEYGACFGVNDQFFMCEPSTYDFIADRMYEPIYKQYAKVIPIHPEFFLAMYCFLNGVGVKSFDATYRLLNDGGPGTNNL